MCPKRVRLQVLALVPLMWGAGAALAEEPITLREGLAIEHMGTGGRSPFFVDPVALAVTLGQWHAPAEGDTITLGDKTAAWRKVTAGEDGWLRVPEMRGGYASFTVESEQDRVMILDARGHSLVYVDGQPRTGDPYSNGLIRVPVLLRAGKTELLFRGGRGQLLATLVEPAGPVVFDTVDDTLPDVIEGEDAELWAGIGLLNATAETASGLAVRATALGADGAPLVVETPVPGIVALAVHKAAVRLPRGAANAEGKVAVTLELLRAGEVAGTRELSLSLRDAADKHVRTFVSGIDGSVQHFAVTPMRRPEGGAAGEGEKAGAPALFLSLHGASVEGRGQANAYAHKDWGYIVAPTNRRPFGFDWEDWGRLDAVEVLDIAGALFGADRQRTYLTGHSMGGHGTWQIGAQFPDRFAAIGPSAGWVSFWSYGGLIDYGTDTPVREAFTRAASPSDTLALSQNYEDLGVYVLHGDADDNVPVSQARDMRRRLAEFHTNFAYYERPGAGHWWGNPCVDWPPMFDFFRANRRDERRDHIRFVTANPAVTSVYRWATVLEQTEPMKLSRFDLAVDAAGNAVTGTTENIARLSLLLGETQREIKSKNDAGEEVSTTGPDPARALTITLDGETVTVGSWLAAQPIVLSRVGGAWAVASSDDPARKGARRAGPFKNAFRNDALLVYATGGDDAEDAWALAKARFDSETFKYRGNGSFVVVSDAELLAAKEGPLADPDRNIVLYGNAETNLAWGAVVDGDVLRVGRAGVTLRGQTREEADMGVLAVRPRRGSAVGLVGIVGGTSLSGCRATDRLPYFVSGVAYPDYTIVTPAVYEQGIDAVLDAGFFGGAWE